MTWMKRWQRRLGALVRPKSADEELNEELAFHIEREARKLIDEGMTAIEARDRAQARSRVQPQCSRGPPRWRNSARRALMAGRSCAATACSR